MTIVLRGSILQPEIPNKASHGDVAVHDESGRAPESSAEKHTEKNVATTTVANVDASSTARKKLVTALIIGALTVAAGVGFYYQQSLSNAAADNSKHSLNTAQSVTVAKATLIPVEDELTVTGTVSAWDPLNIGAEANNLRIKAVNVEEGDFVKKGQTLALLNSALLEGQLDEAKARLRSSKATLKKAITPNRQEEVLALKATLAQSQATLADQAAAQKEAAYKTKDAELNAKRYAELHRLGVSSSVEAETKQLAADSARSQLASSEAKVNAARSVVEENREKVLQAENGGRGEDIEISQATIAQTEAQIKELTEQLNQTIIKAPDDGVISKRSAHLGEIVSTGTPLFSLIRLNKLELRAQVPDIELAKIAVGQKVTISLKEDDTAKFIGKVRLISPLVDDSSRIGIVRVALPEKAGLKPGMFVKGQIKLGTRSALTVPPQAVSRRNGECFVFTIDGERADSHVVKLGSESDGYVEITSGLKPGQLIVCDGAKFLSDRDLVRVSK
ncbi:MAG: efflux RND transporter periplasmic adaptor subunit [Candidatus Obscuribacterales bacterium]|nr:efflux RND transporter periplasmic adaptor subunit [Candidatus Obscuribacterales bacterium]